MINTNVRTKGVKMSTKWGKETLQLENQVLPKASLLLVFPRKQLTLGRFHLQSSHRPELTSNCLSEEL